ncbi:MAG: EVE domain-containing protein [Sphingomonadaceae bacterium]|nr:EVE domain-containing protein [Sphingomonadaceae bacterium]
MEYWLIKSEPRVYSWDDLVRDGRTVWDGVKNASAAINLRAMRFGDECLYYHSNEGKACVGIARVVREAFPDPADPKWVAVDVEPVRPLARPVTLAEARADPRLAAMVLVKNSRLSVQPVTAAEWAAVLDLAATPAS